MLQEDFDLEGTSNSLSLLGSLPASESTSSSLSSLSSLSSPQIKRPTVTELSLGLYRVHWQFTSSSAADGGTFSSSFTIDYFPLSLYNSTTFIVFMRRTLLMYGTKNALRLSCCATSTSASVIPNWLPRDVFMEGGDENMVRVPPSTLTSCCWGLNYWETKPKNSIVLLLQFTVDHIPFPSHLYRLLESQELCDVTFAFSDGRTFKAHRSVLSLGNMYFQNCSRGRVTEAAGDVVNIGDVPYQSFVDMVRYLYTGAIPESYCSGGGLDSLFEMYVLANRYVIPGLRSYCLDRIVPQIDFENVLLLYVRSKALALDSLKIAALSFLAKYASLICCLPSTIVYVRENPEIFLHVSLDVVRHLSGQNSL